MRRGATISDDGLYRYELWRDWSTADAPADAPYVPWVMLNPSTADAEVDDPTIRRCISFTSALGYSRLVVVNLFAYRATRPDDVLEAAAAGVRVTGPRNKEHIEKVLAATRCGFVILAWGAGGNLLKALARTNVEQIAGQHGVTTLCLGKTKNGRPRHPLYLPTDTKLEQYGRKLAR